MSLALELAAGGSAVLVAGEGEHATLETMAASPPGSTLELVVLGAPLRLKVRRCQRVEQPGGPRFRVEGRWIDLSKEQRQYLFG